MPVILCPKCTGKLRLPENLDPRKVKCPSCSHTFMSDEADIEGEEPKSSKKNPTVGRGDVSSRLSSALGGAGKVDTNKNRNKEPDDDFEVVNEDKPARPARRRDDDEDEEPRPKRRNDRDDDDDDRPRSRGRDDDRRRSRDDDDDDRPSRRSRDDDDDDRPRGRGRDRDDRRSRDDDDDRPSRRRSGFDDDDRDRDRGRRGRDRYDDRDDRDAVPIDFGWVRTGLLLNSIGCWLMAGGVAAMTIFYFFILVRLNLGGFFEVLITLGGIAALGGYICTTLGFGFCVAGPAKNGALGFCIAVLCVAGIHLILGIVGLSSYGGGFRYDFATAFRWASVNNHINILSIQLGVMFQGGGLDAVSFIAGLLEIAFPILACLYMKACAKTSRDRSGQDAAGGFVMIWSIVIGSVVGVGIIMTLIATNMRGTTAGVLLSVMTILASGAVGAMYLWMGFISQEVNDGLEDRRGKRKKRRR